VYTDRTLPDAYEQTLPEVFPELAPGNFTWDEDLGAWVWTTFNTYQWDLNYANPEVFLEMLRIMLDLANLGVDILRLDAIAFTWKRLGTNCQNQAEAHLIAQAFRGLLAMAAPATLLKAEAIVAPSDLLPYLGAHRVQRDECQLAYHNQLMVMLWSSLATGDAVLASEALGALPATPTDAAWVTYLRCHDDIGWAVSDDDAARVGISGAAHRGHLAAFYRGDVAGSFASGAAFSSNPESGDERTVGSAAALCGITSAIAAGDTEAVERGIRRLLLAYGVVMAFGGIPLVYMGDELALDNDTSYLAEAALADDSRWMNRPWMPWDLVGRRHRPGTVEQRVFSGMVHLVDVRRATPQLSAGGETWIHRLDDPAVFAWARRHPRLGRFYGLANFAGRDASVPVESLEWAGIEAPIEVLGADVRTEGGRIVLPPLGLAWYVDAADSAVQPLPPG
jgi:amylosucrase